MGGQASPSLAPEPRTEVGIARGREDRRCKVRDLAGGEEEPASPILDHLPRRRDVACDEGPLAGGGLEVDQRLGLARGGHHHEVGRVDEVGDEMVVHPSGETERAVEATGCRGLLDRGAARAVAEDHEDQPVVLS